MYCTRNVTDDLVWVGGNDRRLAIFEGVYSMPNGVSYNSYLLMDDTTVLFDTVDSAVRGVFFENIGHTLGARALDYVIVQHMEPDHSAVLLELLRAHPETTVVCNAKTVQMIRQFFTLDFDLDARLYTVKEGDVLNTGHHELTFVMAPMVHWPEVMVTYDKSTGTLFSADAFGTFGALNGALFADEVDFAHDYMDEARRYYTNIVGKYGAQVTALLGKAGQLDIRMLCPLHGFVWRERIGDFVSMYQKWASYTPEVQGVMIAYASVYGNTAGAVEILSCRLREAGIPTVMYDVSVTPAADIISAAFRYSHFVFAAPTYNNGVFVRMEELLRDLAAHNIQKRTVALIENGSWAPTAGKLMREILAGCKNLEFIEPTLTLRSAMKPEQSEQIDALVAAFAAQIGSSTAADVTAAVDANTLFKLSYGLFVVTAREGEKDNGCIINTAAQVTASPLTVQITVNKQNLTHDMILRTGVFNLCVLTEQAPFALFERFGFASGRDTDKFAGDAQLRTANGVRYLCECVNAVISCRVSTTVDCGTHTLFIATLDEARILSDAPSATYAYYFAHIKPKPNTEKKKGYICKICGYVYEGDELPADFICPLCKHGAEDFEPIA